MGWVKFDELAPCVFRTALGMWNLVGARSFRVSHFLLLSFILFFSAPSSGKRVNLMVRAFDGLTVS